MAGPTWRLISRASRFARFRALRYRFGHEPRPQRARRRDQPLSASAQGQSRALAGVERGDARAPRAHSTARSCCRSGYAACHWCHVMAHECFERPDIAAQMNANFVNIKVDREERPDLDTIYMNALHAMGEQGGWPLTMFLTPAGRAVLGRHLFSAGAALRPAELSASADRDRTRLSRRPAKTSPRMSRR